MQTTTQTTMTTQTGTETRPAGWTRHPLCRRLLACLIVLAFASASLLHPLSAVADDPIHPELREFFPTGKYVLYISGKAQGKARILYSRKAGAFLILGSDYGRALLLQPKTKTVSAIDEDDAARRPDKGIDVVADAAIERLGSIRRVRGGDVVISVEGLRARLRPQEYLIGLKNADELILHTPEYERKGRGYKPGRNEIRRLESSGKETVVRVYFGSWCHTCSRLLPRILKVEKALEGTTIQFEYYGLPKGAKAMARDPLARRNKIRRIPTGLVTIDGASAGRINSTQFARPELALCRLVLKK